MDWKEEKKYYVKGFEKSKTSFLSPDFLGEGGERSLKPSFRENKVWIITPG